MATEKDPTLAGWIITMPTEGRSRQQVRPEHSPSAVEAGIRLQHLPYATREEAQAWLSESRIRLEPTRCLYFQRLKVEYTDGSFTTRPGVI